jgi:hypothetical protein
MSKEFKQMLSACQKADGNCFLGQERGADGGIHATMDHNNTRSIFINTKKKLHRFGHSELKAWNSDIQCSAPP